MFLKSEEAILGGACFRAPKMASEPCFGFIWFLKSEMINHKFKFKLFLNKSLIKTFLRFWTCQKLKGRIRLRIWMTSSTASVTAISRTYLPRTGAATGFSWKFENMKHEMSNANFVFFKMSNFQFYIFQNIEFCIFKNVEFCIFQKHENNWKVRMIVFKTIHSFSDFQQTFPIL